MKIRNVMSYALVFVLMSSLTTSIQAQETGWTLKDEKWFYTTQDGQNASGWQMIDGCWYAFETDGTMKTGWVASDEKWYFMGESGVMQESGWVTSDGADYYLKGTGVMATDYIKDGYELDSTGKAIPMAQSKSVELTDLMNINNQTIEGNLYIDAAKFKELELSGITVTGKIVIMGEMSESKITIKDSTINTISSQTRGAEVTLSGSTSVKTIEIEENSTIKPGENYTGKVESIEIQSTTKAEIKVEVTAKSVLSNTLAPVTVNAPVDNLSVNKKTDLKVNADVSSITVNKAATDTKVEVEKNVTVGSVESETKVEVGGAGSVEDVKGEDITNETKPPKPSGGGGTITPPVITSVSVSNEAEFIANVENTDNKTIVLANDITVDMFKFSDVVKNNDVISRAKLSNSKVIDLNGNILTLTEKVSIQIAGSNTNFTFRNGTIEAKSFSNESTKALFEILDSNKFTFDGVTLNTTSTGLLPNGSAAELNVLNSTINGGIFGVGTNASNAYRLVINIENSTITTSNNSKDNCPVYMNIPSILNITNSTLTGDRQGLLVRGGTAVVTSTTINYTNAWATKSTENAELFYSGTWTDGNNLPAAPVVIGNVHATDYKYLTDVTFTDVTIDDAISGLTGNLTGINGKKIVKVDENRYTSGEKFDVKITFTDDNFDDSKIHVMENPNKLPTLPVIE